MQCAYIQIVTMSEVCYSRVCQLNRCIQSSKVLLNWIVNCPLYRVGASNAMTNWESMLICKPDCIKRDANMIRQPSHSNIRQDPLRLLPCIIAEQCLTSYCAFD